MSDIKLNTDTLYSYGDQLMGINRRILEVNLQMKTLYGSVRLVDLGKLIRADHLANFSASLVGCANYCYGTANEFNALETRLAQENPLDFNKPAVAGLAEFLYDAASAVGSAVQVAIEITEVVNEAIKDAVDEAAKWLGEHWIDILDVVSQIATIAAAAALLACGPVGWIIGGIMIAVAFNNLINDGAKMIFGNEFNLLESALGSEAYAVLDIGVTVASLVVPVGALTKASATGAKIVGSTSKAGQSLAKGASKMANMDVVLSLEKAIKGSSKSAKLADIPATYRINNAVTRGAEKIMDFGYKKINVGNALTANGLYQDGCTLLQY